MKIINHATLYTLESVARFSKKNILSLFLKTSVGFNWV